MPGKRALWKVRRTSNAGAWPGFPTQARACGSTSRSSRALRSRKEAKLSSSSSSTRSGQTSMNGPMVSRNSREARLRKVFPTPTRRLPLIRCR
jgi:hypothetical protein